MLKDFVDHTYLINLKESTQRLASASEECRKIGLPFERWEAVNGKKEGLIAKPYPGVDRCYWNAGAAGLVKTTSQILENAIRKGYRRILILEDDIEFSPDANRVADESFHLIPKDWQMLQLGSQHCKKPEMISRHIVRIKFAFCLHAYIVNENVFKYYKWLCDQMEKQLDLITAEDIQPFGHCYAIFPNIAFQKPSYSNISERNVNYQFLKQNQKFY